MNIGSIIEKIRNDHGWSQDELADRCGTTKSNLSRIEKNKQWPREDLLEKIASALDVRVYQLFAMAEGASLPTQAPEYNRDERELIKAWRSMDSDAQSNYIGLAKSLAKKGPKSKN